MIISLQPAIYEGVTTSGELVLQELKLQGATSNINNTSMACAHREDQGAILASAIIIILMRSVPSAVFHEDNGIDHA